MNKPKKTVAALALALTAALGVVGVEAAIAGPAVAHPKPCC